MPSARASQLKGGGGILRRKDGTIVDIQFTSVNPLFDASKPLKPRPGQKPSDFKWLYGVLTIQEDGREELSYQPLKVGGVEDYAVVLDGRGISGEKGIGKTSEFGIFLESFSNPKDGGDGFDETNFPEDPEGLVADFSQMRGARLMFDWVLDESKWGKANPRLVKGKNGQPDKKYPRENLVTAAYYGQVDVSKVVAPKPAVSSPSRQTLKPGTTKPVSKAPAVTSADIEVLAEVSITAALKAAKEHTLSKNKLSVKLLTALNDKDADTREAVRAWALDLGNLAGIDDVTVNRETEMVTLTVAA